MSRLIKLTEEHNDLIDKMVDMIRNTKMVGGEFKFTAKLPEIERVACVFFTPEAYSKMLSLIMTFNNEVGWYATAHRHGELEDDIYIIDDILVFPQEVTSVTVDSDDERRVAWFDGLSSDTLLNIRCDMHSHVNMGVSPSGTDDKEVEEVLENLNGDAFRIFMIWNKKLEYSCRIFDMAKNIFFGTKDVVVDVLHCEIDLFLEEAKQLVRKKTVTYSNKSVSTTKKTEDEEKKNTTSAASPYDDDDDDDFLGYQYDDDYTYGGYRYKGKQRYGGYYGYEYY